MEGKDRLDDVVRWEQWEAKGGLKKVNQPPHIKPTGMTGSAAVAVKSENRRTGAHSDHSAPQGLRLPVKPNVDSDGPAMLIPVPSANIPSSLTCKSNASNIFI